MLFKQAARGDERIYGTYQNVEASSLTTGYAVALAQATASFNGTQACLAGTAAIGRQSNWIGQAAYDIAPNAYGLVQLYGAVASVFVSNVGTSITFGIGAWMVPSALPGGLFCISAPTFATSGFAFLTLSNDLPAVSAAGWVSGFMRHGL
jgi:hypothetical protein